MRMFLSANSLHVQECAPSQCTSALPGVFLDGGPLFPESLGKIILLFLLAGFLTILHRRPAQMYERVNLL